MRSKKLYKKPFGKNALNKKALKRIITTAAASAMLLSGCSGESEKTASTLPTETQTETTQAPTEPPGPDLTGLAQSPLSGFYVDEELVSQRPVSVMINNHHRALPQSGIAEADIIYETLAEGGITRLLAVFLQPSGEKIGPVRSCREYYTGFALNHDAFYIHHGGSPTGYSAIKNRGITALDGMAGGEAFFRDPSRTGSMYEHSSYVKASGIYEQLARLGVRAELESGLEFFKFADPYEEEIFPEGIEATEIILPISNYQTSEFYFDEELGLYERHQNSAPQTDSETEEVLRTKNIILQFAAMRVIDSEGRMDIDTIGSGTGKYISNGTACDISWKKPDQHTPTKFYTENGKELVLNCGVTWIEIIPPDCAVSYAPAPPETAPEQTESEASNG
ncbi:MAG: DUF3048 domain-containing protein [Firmicutes bacterium]|nr:DUF3048 domain-containing protein [Bacillota bacterium]